MNDQNQWISVDERLPAEPSPNVVFEAVDYIVTDGFHVGIIDFQRGNGGASPWADWSSYGFIMRRTITHWMPLPEPPK